MTNLPSLNVVSAGAGSGKTFKIKETVGQWVKAGLVRPDRIVAVTFTEAAAAELKERLRKELIDLGRPGDALKLDQAYISTIHAFGLRILTEFAFDGGMPPRSRLLDGNEETALLRQAMATTDSLDVLTTELRRYGYAYDGGSNTSAEEQFRRKVRQIIGTLRTVGQNTRIETLTNFSRTALENGYGPTCNGPLALKALHKAVTNLLENFPSDISVRFDGNKSAVGQFRINHADLTRARDDARLSTDWPLWRGLGKLRQSKRGAPTPDGYDELADAVIVAAEKLSQHPGPLRDAVEHGASLIGSAYEATAGYGEDKRKSALVDYTDMVAIAHEIIKSDGSALNALAERIDCLVIDEFQDTNPLQFSLLWLLQRAGIPTLIVGDLKQAIMGFQGADPRLMEKLLSHEDAKADTLDNNWRTQPSLMPFMNAAGTALFGDAYVDLSARASEGFQVPLEILEQPKPPKGGARRAVWVLRIAERIRALLDDPSQFVLDPASRMKRRLTAGDIAILCPTNNQVQAYADALRSYGVRAKVSEYGWLSSRIVQLASHALQYLENPADKHAALYLSCTEFGEHDLQSAISDLIDRDRITDPLLDRLQCFQDETNDVAIDVILARAIGVLDLYGRIARWPDAAKHRADLLRLESEAKAFVEAKPETLASGGFFGSGAKTFLAWLSDKVQQDNEGDQRPDPDASTTDAVETVTWHRSKGREWPVVFVCGWDAGVNPKLPKVGVEYENFGNLDAVLDDARISFIPEFAAKEVNDRFLAPMADATELSAKRLIYVALTRAKERLVLEWHSHLTSSSKTTYHSVFQDTASADLQETGFKISGDVFPCEISRNDGTPPDLQGGSSADEILPTFGRNLLDPAPMQEREFEMFTSPSSGLSTTGTNPPLPEEFGYGTPLVLDLDLHGAEYGLMLHRCFEALTASPTSEKYLSDAAGRVITEEQASAISASHAALLDWLRENLSASSIKAEVPFSTMTVDGGVCTGIIDLLVETPNGLWVIDHKSDRFTDEGAILGNYWPQLLAYQEALLELDLQVAGVGLNLVNEGKLLLARLWVEP
jgi:ATP-dependent helicase/nuclease subunit A